MERLALEEKARKEHEEYLKMKASFQIEEEGFDECDEEEQENLLKSFIDHIEKHKVVILENLATHFKLKTQAVIDRITDLQNDGILTFYLNIMEIYIILRNTSNIRFMFCLLTIS